MKLIYFIEIFTENYLFYVSTALKFEADISIRYMLFLTICWGTV